MNRPKVVVRETEGENLSWDVFGKEERMIKESL